MKRFVINKKIASVALSSAMVISNVSYNPVLSKAEELNAEVVESTGDTETTIETTSEPVENTEQVAQAVETTVQATETVEENLEEVVTETLPEVVELINTAIATPIVANTQYINIQPTTGTLYEKSPTIINDTLSGSSILTNDDGLYWNFKQTAQAPTTLSSSSYLMFPDVTGNCTLKGDIVIHSSAETGSLGVLIGVFNEGTTIPTMLTGLNLNGQNGTITNADTTTTIKDGSIKGLYSTTAGTSISGAGMNQTNAYYNNGDKISFEVKKSTSSGIVFSAVVTDAITKETKTFTKNIGYTYLNALIQDATANRFGISFSSVDATVTNLVFTDANGTVLYSQKEAFIDECKAPTISNVSATFNAETKQISTSWTDDGLGYGDYTYTAELFKDGSTTPIATKTILAGATKTTTFDITEVGNYVVKVNGSINGTSTTAMPSDTLVVDALEPTYEPTLVNATNLTSKIGLYWDIVQTGGDVKVPSQSSYILFPQIAGNSILKGSVVINSVDNGDNKGILAGVFDGGTTTPTMLTGLNIDGNKNVDGLYSNTSGTIGGTGMNESGNVYNIGDKISFEVKKHSTSGVVFTAVVTNPTTNETKTFTKNIGYTYLNPLIQDTTSNRFGLSLGGVNATITDLQLIDATGKTVYNQNETYANDVVVPIVNTVSATFDSTNKQINASWTDLRAGVGTTYSYNVELYNSNNELIDSTTVTNKTATFDIIKPGTYTVKVNGQIGTTVTNVVSSSEVVTGDFEVSYAPKLVNSANLTSTPALNWNIKQTGGNLLTLSNASYLFFPTTRDAYTVEGDILVNSTSTTDAYSGVTLSIFNKGTTPTVGAGVGVNGQGQTLQYYSNQNNIYGVGGTTANSGAYAIGTDKVHFKAVKTATGISYSFTNGETSTFTNSPTYGTSWLTTKLNDKEANRIGLSFANVDATVSSLVLKDDNGNVLYDQNDIYKIVGAAPIVKTVTATFDDTNKQVKATWVDETVGSGDYSYTATLYKDGVLAQTKTILATDEKAVAFNVLSSGNYVVKVNGTINNTPTTVISSNALDVTINLGSTYAPKKYETTIGALTIEPTGYRDTLTDVSAQGTINGKGTLAATPSTFAAPKSSFYLMPSTTKACKLEFEIKPGAISDTSSVGSATDNGITIGLFSGADGTAPQFFTGAAARTSTATLCALYSKPTTGATGTSSGSITNQIPLSKDTFTKVTIERAADTYTYVTFADKYGTTISKVSLKNGNVYNLGAGWSSIGSNARLGLGVVNGSATIRNVKYYEEGTLLYEGDGVKTPVGTIPVVATVSDITASESNSKLTVSWTENTAPSGDGAYKVEISKDDGATWTTLQKAWEDTTYTTSITDSGKYKFKITGAMGTLATPSQTSSTLQILAPLDAPVVNFPTFGDKTVTVTWNAIEGAQAYDVYKKSADETTFTKVASVTEPTYTDTAVENGMPYYYYTIPTSTINENAHVSNTVFAYPNVGHKGDYVYENEACKIAITNKSNDTLLTENATLEGTVDKVGTLDLMVNGIKVDSKTFTEIGSFDFDFKLNNGRNDVNLIFTDASGNKTRQTFNFVYLTNYEYIVDKNFTGTDGTTDTTIPSAKIYKTIGAAISDIKTTGASASDKVVVFIKNGAYTEYLTVDSANVTLIGEDRENTKIQYNTIANGYTAMTARAAFRVSATATNFTAENITFENTYDYITAATANAGVQGQADAIDVSADKSIFVNSKFVGYQDTLHATANKQYYYKCRIEGLVDFIYGDQSAQVLFEDSDIVFKYVAAKPQGYIAAPKHNTGIAYGYTFNKCRVIAEEGCTGTNYSLGRPYGPNAYVVFIDTYMPKLISDGQGFSDWDSSQTAVKAKFYEQGSFGPGFAVNQNREQLSKTQATNYLTTATLGWSPYDNTTSLSNYYVTHTQPVVSTVTSTLSTDKKTIDVAWTSSTEATGDGAYKVEVSVNGGAFSTVTPATKDKTLSYTVPSDGSYVFRVSGILTGKADTTSQVSSAVTVDTVVAVVTGMTPTTNTFATSNGGSYKVTLTGTNLNKSVFTLKGSDGAEITPDATSTSTAITFTVNVSGNTSATADKVVTYTLNKDGVATTNTTVATVPKATAEIIVTVTGMTPATNTFATSNGGSYNVTVTGTNIDKSTLTLKGSDGSTINANTGGSATSQTFTVNVSANTSTIADKVVTYTLNKDGVATTNTTVATVPKATAVATVTSMTPATNTFATSNGGSYTVTVTGTNLDKSTFTLKGSNGATINANSGSTSTSVTFTVTLGANTSTTTNNVVTYTLNKDGVATSNTTVATVPKATAVATVTSMTPATNTFATSNGGSYTVTVTGTNLDKSTFTLKGSDNSTIPANASSTATEVTFTVKASANTSTSADKVVTYTLNKDGVATTNTTISTVPKATVTPVAKSVTPAIQEINYLGKTGFVITVRGQGLTSNNITLVNGANTYKPTTISDTEAVFKVNVPANTSTTKTQTIVYNVVVSGKQTGLSSTITVGTVPANTESGSSSSGSTITKKPITSTPTDSKTTTETKAETKEAPTVVAEKVNEYSESNKELLAKTYSEVKVSKNDNKPVTLSYDVSDVKLSDTEKSNMVAVKIDPTTGDVTYLGGRLDEKTNTFVTDTKATDGNFAVIVADPSLYNQATFKVNDKTTNVNGKSKKLDVAPKIVDGTTFMPVRAVSEALGAKVTFNPLTKTATITIDGITTKFKVGESQNGEPASFIENGRLQIPVRAVSEALGANVNWFADDQTIQVTK